MFFVWLIENGYYGVNTALNWNDSESYCESTYGTTLATIRSSTDNQLAMIAAVYSEPGVSQAWIGFNDMALEGTFEWIDGTRNDFYNYTNWASGEPNDANGGEHCTLIKNDGTWNDGICGHAEWFVCNAYPRTTLGM